MRTKHLVILILTLFFLSTCPSTSFALDEFPGTGDRVVYSRSEQQVWLVDSDDNVVDTWLVTGHRKYPVNGSYRVYSRSIKSRSIDGKVNFTHMVRFTKGPNGTAIGFHSLPVFAGTNKPIMPPDMIGTPEYSSPGCIRQLSSDAAKLWEWTKVGSKVVVIN